MHFTFSTLVVSLVLTSATAIAAPLEARQDTLKPFEVTAMVHNRPTGRPGRYPWTRIRANVTDPNSYTFNWDGSIGTAPANSQGLNCYAEWYPGEYTEGRSFPCDPTEKGHWVMQPYAGEAGDFSVSDFKLKFIHVVEPGLLVAPFRARIEGEAVFRGGPNGTTSSGCFSTGACNAVLKPEVVPLLVPVTIRQ